MVQGFPDWIERQSLVARNLRMVFVPTPKAGCTSMMWALAEAEGTVRSAPFISSSGEQSRVQTIHDPMVHGLPNLAGLESSEREMVLSDPSWTRFCLSRDPYSRLLSGWINRVLLNSPDLLIDDLVFARRDNSEDFPTDLGSTFRDFVRQLLVPVRDRISDHHFTPQCSLLRPDLFPYTDVVKLTELDRFVARVGEEAAARRGFAPQRMNASLRIDVASVYDARTAGLVDEFFADDFVRLGYSPTEFPAVAPALPLTSNELDLVRIVRSKSDRLVDFEHLHTPVPKAWRGLGRARGAVVRRLRSRR